MEASNRTEKIRVAVDVIERIAELSEKTRRPMSKIATEALRYALEHVKMVEAECYDLVFGEDGDPHE